MKNPFEGDLAKLKTMTFKQKFDYIWGYYKGPIIAVVFAIIFIVSLIKTIAGSNRDAINIIICDQQCPNYETASQVINEAFTEYMGDEADEKDMIVIDSSLSLSDAQDNYTQSIMQQKLSALVSSNTANMMIADKEDIIGYGTLGMFTDLEEILDADTFAALKERNLLITSTVPADDTLKEPTPEYTYYSGIDISSLDIKLLDDAGITLNEKSALGIPVNGRNEDRAVAFLNLLLADSLSK